MLKARFWIRCLTIIILLSGAVGLAGGSVWVARSVASLPVYAFALGSTNTVDADSTAAATEMPRYGGTYIACQPGDTAAWDPTQQMDLMGFQISLGNEALIQGDWAKGPAGTGDTDWLGAHLGQTRLLTGDLAASYEILDSETLIFHIRPGVHWWNKAPANGREFTAEDAAWNITRQWENPQGTMKMLLGPAAAPTSVTVVDRYTVVCKYQAGTVGIHLLEDGNRIYCMLPELYPNQTDWHNALGTGAFQIVDYVPSSSFIFVRNPDYWGTDPYGPGQGNRLPYLDGVRVLVISDTSTQLAAFRTGKIDTLGSVDIDDLNQMKATMPWQLEYRYTYSTGYIPTTRLDKFLPANDIRVRQAMNLAVDKQAILNDYYIGQGELLGYPYTQAKGLTPYYTPLEQLPADCQEIVRGGNQNKARQLLAEAGYPNGFKTKIACRTTDVDVASILKSYLANVGIDLEINIYETGVWFAMLRGRTWDEMIMVWPKQQLMPYYLYEWRAGSNDSCALINFPETDAVYATIQQNLAINDAGWSLALKNITPFMLRQSIGIYLPAPYNYIVWQPWLKNYYGAVNLNAFTPFRNCYYNWIDQDLKKQLTGIGPPPWSVPMIATTPSEGTNLNLELGERLYATGGFDSGIDVPHPPPGPGITADSYFAISSLSFPQLDKDYRAHSNSEEWTLHVHSSTQSITLAWDASRIPAALSAYMNTGVGIINMKTQNSIVLPAGTHNISVRVSIEIEIQVPLKAGWNMVSVPVAPQNALVTSVFAGTEIVYTWDPVARSYYVPTIVEPGKGYWVAAVSDKVLVIRGIPCYTWSSGISSGWNMIGSVLGTVSFTSPNDSPDGSVEAFTYWWDPVVRSYIYGSTIESGKGYWIAATQGCVLTLTLSPPAPPTTTPVPTTTMPP